MIILVYSLAENCTMVWVTIVWCGGQGNIPAEIPRRQSQGSLYQCCKIILWIPFWSVYKLLKSGKRKVLMSYSVVLPKCVPLYEEIYASVRIDNSTNVEDLSIYVKCLPKKSLFNIHAHVSTPRFKEIPRQHHLFSKIYELENMMLCLLCCIIIYIISNNQFKLSLYIPCFEFESSHIIRGTIMSQ